jgi:hypothetical protein
MAGAMAKQVVPSAWEPTKVAEELVGDGGGHEGNLLGSRW